MGSTAARLDCVTGVSHFRPTHPRHRWAAAPRTNVGISPVAAIARGYWVLGPARCHTLVLGLERICIEICPRDRVEGVPATPPQACPSPCLA
jgi:hypothetical protein